jgi:hypothetical protein
VFDSIHLLNFEITQWYGQYKYKIIYESQWSGIVTVVHVKLHELTVNFPLRDEAVSVFSKQVLSFTV